MRDEENYDEDGDSYGDQSDGSPLKDVEVRGRAERSQAGVKEGRSNGNSA